MTPLERAIVDAVAHAVQGGHRLRSIYLRPQDLDELGHPPEIGGLPVKRVSEKGRPTLYTRSGVALPIRVNRPQGAVGGFTRTQQLILVSLLKGWPCVPKHSMRYQLQRKGLIAPKEVGRRHNGRDCKVHELRLTGRGEADAQAIWDRLSRDERSALHAAALRSGL